MDEIALDPIIQEFDEFIDEETNTRIVLSGPFGIGKTFFLEKFFKEVKNDKYLPIVIRPISYEILQNEDVFKFIQYDILKEIILNQGLKIDEIKQELKEEVKNKEIIKSSLPAFFNLLKSIPKLGELATLGEGFYNFFQEISDIEDKEGKTLNKLTKQIDTHFLNAFDDTGKVIKNYLNKLSEKKSEDNSLKKVLIIDDLDRLDPDHIFRIFNVFSAYLDKQIWKNNSKDNKKSEETKTIFGFDKVIISCDIENIRKIFHHKYGAETDFDGYIDKFYSKRIYSFNQVSEKVHNALKSELNSATKPKVLSVNEEFMPQVLTLLLFSGSINLRFVDGIKYNTNIDKVKLQKISFNINQSEVRIDKDDILLSFEVLLHFFSYKKEKLGQKIEKAINFLSLNEKGIYYKKIGNETRNYLFKRMLLYADMTKHQFFTNSERESQSTINITNQDFGINYEITKNFNGIEKFKIDFKSAFNITPYKFYTLYKRAYDKCIEYNLL